MRIRGTSWKRQEWGYQALSHTTTNQSYPKGGNAHLLTLAKTQQKHCCALVGSCCTGDMPSVLGTLEPKLVFNHWMSTASQDWPSLCPAIGRGSSSRETAKGQGCGTRYPGRSRKPPSLAAARRKEGSPVAKAFP